MPIPSLGLRVYCTVLSLVALACVATATHGAEQITPSAMPHSLDGKIWDVRARKLVTVTELTARLAGADFVLLGEVHDNREHHHFQAMVLAALVANGARPAFALEQFDREHQPAIDAALSAHADAETLADAGKFDRKGWVWGNYEPLVQIAINARLPIVAANVSRRAARELSGQGFGLLAAPPDRLALTAVWTGARENALVRAVVDAHCGQLPPDAAAPLTRAQRARDATMADSLLAQRAAGAVLIAGVGHVRRDIAVPLYLRARAPDSHIVAIGMTEVLAGRDSPSAYEIAAADGSADPVFDYLWFAPPADRPDPCAGFTMPQRAPGQN
ncbi:MAG: ChaN family lipoprotein [Casimicrobiaceae bacterium]